MLASIARFGNRSVFKRLSLFLATQLSAHRTLVHTHDFKKGLDSPQEFSIIFQQKPPTSWILVPQHMNTN